MHFGAFAIALQETPPWQDVLLWSGILLAAVLVGVIVVAILRRMLTSKAAAPAQGFTLHELRELHDLGRISEAEFERAKAAIIARARAPKPGAEEDSAERAVCELKERRQSAPPPPADKLDPAAHRENAPRAPGESHDEPDNLV